MTENGYITLLKGNRDFRLLFTARMVSLLGDWFNVLAVLALLRELGGRSASAFAWILILKTCPVVFTSPIAGVIVDRFSRRAIMMASDVARGLVVLGMIGLTLMPSVALLYVLVVLQACFATFFEPARNALLPDIVSADELPHANALGAAMWSTMLTLGAALGGLATALLGWQLALLVDASSYVVSLALLVQLREPPWQPEARGPATIWELTGLADVARGLRYVVNRPRILSLVGVKSAWCLAGGITLVLTVLGEQVYPIAGRPILGVAVLYCARGLGTGAGPLLSRWISRNDPGRIERMIWFGFLNGALFYLLLPLTGHIALAALLVLLAHLGGATIWVFSSLRLQQLVPTEMRGRVFATEMAGFTTVMSLSTYIYGQLVDAGSIGVNSLTGVIGLSLLVPFIAWGIRGHLLGWGDGEPLGESPVATDPIH